MGGGGQNTPWGALSLTTQAGVDLWGGVLTMCQNTVSTVRFFLPVRVRARPVGLLFRYKTKRSKLAYASPAIGASASHGCG